MSYESLSSRQFIIASVYGAVFWFIAAMFIRFGIPWGLYDRGLSNIVLFVASVPASVPFVVGVAAVAGLRRSQYVAGMAVADLTAMLLDGIALTWAGGLYGEPGADILPGAAWLLWGVGLSLCAAFVLERRGGPALTRM
jgi:hypothetical protein